MPDREHWNDRAAAAEFAVLSRYVHRFAGMATARSAWPARAGLGGVLDELGVWHYWWHAHVIDCAGDAARHRPSSARRRRIELLARTVRVRTLGRWTNRFYDDIAWMGVALRRAAPVSRLAAIIRIADRLERGIDADAGALPWHVGSDLFNAPANGPAAILFARTGRTASARQLADWIARMLDDPETGLVRDGIEQGAVRDAIYTYNQGVAIGAALALAESDEAAGSETAARQRERAARLVRAVQAWCATDDLLPAAGGGDGGLFAGILCRYLAEAAVALRADSEGADAAASARRLVLANARALWDGRAEIDGRPMFAADPRRAAIVPPGPRRPRRATGGATSGDDQPDGDLSVQLSAWMTLEAAVTVTTDGLTS